MAKSPEEMAASMIANLHKKTGQTLAEWLEIARQAPAAKHREIVSFLKSEHGMTHGYANLVATKFLEADAGGDASRDPVDAQYAGPKAALRPIYEALIKAVEEFGDDVEIAPKKSYVSLRRNKQFALIQPSTRTRVDVGLNLKEHDVTDRLEASGSFNAMVSHRVRLGSAADVDQELIGWLKQAYLQS